MTHASLLPLLVLAPFAALVIFLGRKTKYYYLDTLPLADGEALRWEEDVRHATVSTPSMNRGATYPWCRVRATDRRLIVAQKVLFSKRYLVRQVFLFHGEVSARDQAEGVFKGYSNLRVDPASATVKGDVFSLSAKPELDSALVFLEVLELRVADPQRYLMLVQG